MESIGAATRENDKIVTDNTTRTRERLDPTWIHAVKRIHYSQFDSIT